MRKGNKAKLKDTQENRRYYKEFIGKEGTIAYENGDYVGIEYEKETQGYETIKPLLTTLNGALRTRTGYLFRKQQIEEIQKTKKIEIFTEKEKELLKATTEKINKIKQEHEQEIEDIKRKKKVPIIDSEYATWGLRYYRDEEMRRGHYGIAKEIEVQTKNYLKDKLILDIPEKLRVTIKCNLVFHFDENDQYKGMSILSKNLRRTITLYHADTDQICLGEDREIEQNITKSPETLSEKAEKVVKLFETINPHSMYGTANDENEEEESKMQRLARYCSAKLRGREKQAQYILENDTNWRNYETIREGDTPIARTFTRTQITVEEVEEEEQEEEEEEEDPYEEDPETADA